MRDGWEQCQWCNAEMPRWIGLECCDQCAERLAAERENEESETA